MDRAERALSWSPFVRQIGDIDALKLNVAHQIKAYLSSVCTPLAFQCNSSAQLFN
jgi:hypothetical protein